MKDHHICHRFQQVAQRVTSRGHWCSDQQRQPSKLRGTMGDFSSRWDGRIPSMSSWFLPLPVSHANGFHRASPGDLFPPTTSWIPSWMMAYPRSGCTAAWFQKGPHYCMIRGSYVCPTPLSFLSNPKYHSFCCSVSHCLCHELFSNLPPSVWSQRWQMIGWWVFVSLTFLRRPQSHWVTCQESTAERGP